MKKGCISRTLVVLAAISFWVVEADYQHKANSCNLLKLTNSLKPIQSSPEFAACVESSGYALLPPVKMPSKDEAQKICVSSDCNKVMMEVEKLSIADCKVDILGGVNIKQMLTKIRSKCDNLEPAATPAPSQVPSKKDKPSNSETPAATPTAKPTEPPAEETPSPVQTNPPSTESPDQTPQGTPSPPTKAPQEPLIPTQPPKPTAPKLTPAASSPIPTSDHCV